MKIWFLAPHEQPHGQASRTFDFSRELVARGHEVSVFTSSFTHRTHEEYLDDNEQWRAEDWRGVRVVWLRTVPYDDNGWKRGLNMLSYGRQALRTARELGDSPDVVVGDSVPPSAGWAGLRISRRYNAGFVYQVRDVWPIALVYDGGLSRWSPVYFAFRWMEKRLYRHANRICATMPYLKDHVGESGGRPDRVVWIPNGVDLQKYEGLAPYGGGTDEALTVMYIGGFGIAHDVVTIVRAAKLLKDRGGRGWRFVFYGDGVKLSSCEEEAARLGLDNVEFRGCVDKEEVPRTQLEADIFVASVTDSDSYKFGLNLNKLFDYLASGRPTIFSGRAPSDPVRDAGCGFSIAPESPEAMADSLWRLQAMGVEARRELGCRARKFAEDEFDVRRLVDRMEALLEDAARDRVRQGQ